MSLVRSVAAWSVRVAGWVVIVGALAVLTAGVGLPRVAGATPYTVLTGSMRPALPPGALAVVRPVDPEHVRVGDVVTVQLASGESGVVTHRVVEVVTTLDGRRRFRTQGDANDVADAELRRPEQIRGRLWYAVPYLGHAGRLLTGDQRDEAVGIAAGGLLVYAAAIAAGVVRDRRRAAAAGRE